MHPHCLERSGTCIQALDALLDPQPLPAEKTLSGNASVGRLELQLSIDQEIGIWEISPSTSIDIECDEVFVVLAGRATVTLEETGDQLQLAPGVVGRFRAGTRTTWTVTERLRKVYFLPPALR